MNKCICVNIDKKEYFDFENFDGNIMEGSILSNTLEYFLATEWRGDKIIFVFDNSGKSSVFPDEDNAFEYIAENFTERSVLNSVPEYTYIANINRHEYYFKDALPESDDSAYVNPLPFILSEPENDAFEENQLSDKEEKDIGRWFGDNIVVTNDDALCNGYKLFESPYIKVNKFTKAISGLNIVITGTISGYTRSEIEDFIRKHGGNLQSSVTKKTDFLVVADKPGKKKIDDAAKYGTKTISVNDFFSMLGE